MTERVFLEDRDAAGAERFRVEGRRVRCASCGVLCAGSLCRECAAVERAWPIQETGYRRQETDNGDTGKASG